MNIDIKVTNLGKLKEGSFKIRPITVLTGPNGTGKSFLTKSLYSILNTINVNSYHLDLIRSISTCKLHLDTFIGKLSYAANNDYLVIQHLLKSDLSILEKGLNQATELDLLDYFDFSKAQAPLIDNISSKFDSYILSLSKKPKKHASIKKNIKTIRKALLELKNNLENGIDIYSKSLTKNLSNEIKENFQIPDLSQLVSFNEKSAKIDIGELAHITFSKNGLGFNLQHDFINTISSLSRVVFFESPAYWKVRDALMSAKEARGFPFYLRKSKRLTGVPKYFYDLDTAIKEQVKDRDLSPIEDLIDKIEQELGGEFVFSGDDIVFKDHVSNKEISKNLISFGMTNLGMIHALLKNNVITPGSFVFIDEPETNLHPRWQVLLMNILIELASRDINIVIATHSVDMLKALEVGIKSKDLLSNEFMSTYYFDIDGSQYQFDSKEPQEQLIEARNELSSSYESLYFQGCLNS